MALDDVIDQLSFGSSAPAVSSCLGLYLSPETIYIAETHSEKGRAVVDHLVRIPVPVPDAPKGTASTGTLNTDFLMDNAKLSVLIRQSMSQIRWNTKDVMVTLSHHLGLLRYFTMPAVERRFWKSSIPLEAKKYIPIPFDALSHDFQVIPLSPDSAGRARQGALIAVTQRKNLANISALLEGLGLRMVGLEVAPCSVLRLWESLDKGSQGRTKCQVHFDGGNIRILLSDKGLPVFFRELFLGSEASLSDLRKVDLGGCVGFAQKQLGVGALTQARVSGTAPNLNQWQEAFGQELGVQAGHQDTASMLGIKGGDWGGYAAIGASVRFSAPSAMTLDLGRIGQVTEEEHRAARDILAVGLVAALWFAGLGLGRDAHYRYQARELSQYRREPDIEAVFLGKDESAINAMLQEMQAQVDLSQGLGVSGVKATAILKDLVDNLPEKMWLTHIALTNPLAKSRQQSLQLTLEGHVVAATLAQEQEMALQFKDKLLRSALIGERFPDIQVTVSGKPLGVESTHGLNPDELTKLLEQRTSFAIAAKPRR